MSTATLKKFALTAAGTAFIALGAGTVEAATFTEVGDAGSSIATAQNAGGIEVTGISGTLPNSDTDLFKLTYDKLVNFKLGNLLPNIQGNFSFDIFNLSILDGLGNSIATCSDCWFQNSGTGSTVFDLSLEAGEYYVSITDTNNFGGNSLNSYSFDIKAEVVPEPASVLGLLAIGAMGAGSALKRKKNGDA